MRSTDFDQQVASLAALGEPIRRDLYRFVVAQSEPVSREAAAAGIGVPRHVAKFHLDKLEEDGLLEVEYRRPPGRSGPGAGRPSKLYRRANRQLAVSLPGRRYEVAAQILAEGIETATRTGRPVGAVLSEVARATGREWGEQAAETDRDELAAAGRVLAAAGYEPHRSTGHLRLANCPFHDVAIRHTELICGINRDLISGMLEALPAPEVRAELDPGPDRCCVTVNSVRPQ